MTKLFIQSCLKLNIHNNIYVSYSGGLDSSVLLKMCCNLFKKPLFKIKAIHINYSHNIVSKNLLDFCRLECNKYKIPLIHFCMDSSLIKNNIEEKLRIARYKMFLSVIKKNTSFFIAHHSSDLLETFLLNLTRGCGLVGLLGIKEKILKKNINILRPFLQCDKHNIYDYAIKNKINYIIDFSNFSFNFNRNFIRFKINLAFNEKWPNLDKSIIRCINILKSNNFFVYTRCKKILNNDLFNSNFLTIYMLKKLPTFIRYEIIRTWIVKKNLKSPSYSHLLEIDKIIYGDFKYEQKIKIDNYLIIRGAKNIYIFKNTFLKKKIKKLNNFFYKNYNKNQIKTFNYKSIVRKYNIYIYKQYTYPVVKYNKFIFSILGVWQSYFYYSFLRSIIKIKILI